MLVPAALNHTAALRSSCKDHTMHRTTNTPCHCQSIKLAIKQVVDDTLRNLEHTKSRMHAVPFKSQQASFCTIPEKKTGGGGACPLIWDVTNDDEVVEVVAPRAGTVVVSSCFFLHSESLGGSPRGRLSLSLSHQGDIPFMLLKMLLM